MKYLGAVVGILIALIIVANTEAQTSLGNNQATRNKDILLSILQEVKEIHLDVQIIKDGLRSKEVKHSKFCPEHPMDGHTYDYPDDPHGTNFPPKYKVDPLVEANDKMLKHLDGPTIGNGG